jgi:hypothetical protein
MDGFFGLHLHLVEIDFTRIGHAVIDATNIEDVEMVVLPAHNRLKDAVQLGEGDVVGHLKPAPDRRTDPLEGDLELIYGPNPGFFFEICLLVFRS